MSKHKSIIEDVELKSGLTAYVQINENGLSLARVSLSFDDKVSSYQVTMTTEELQQYSDRIQKALSDFDDN